VDEYNEPWKSMDWLIDKGGQFLSGFRLPGGREQYQDDAVPLCIVSNSEPYVM